MVPSASDTDVTMLHAVLSMFMDLCGYNTCNNEHASANSLHEMQTELALQLTELYNRPKMTTFAPRGAATGLGSKPQMFSMTLCGRCGLKDLSFYPVLVAPCRSLYGVPAEI